jgi:hypothetical protein
MQVCEELEKKEKHTTDNIKFRHQRERWFCEKCKVWKWVHPGDDCDQIDSHKHTHHAVCSKIWEETKGEGMGYIEPYMFYNWFYRRRIKKMTRDADLERYRLYCFDKKDLVPPEHPYIEVSEWSQEVWPDSE